MPTDHEVKFALNRQAGVSHVKHEKLLHDHLTAEEQGNVAVEFARLDDAQTGSVTMQQYMEGEAEWHLRVYGREPTKLELKEGQCSTRTLTQKWTL